MAASKSLPARPSLESLRKEAKKLARDVAAGDAGAIARVQAHLPNVEPTLTQRNAQLVIAREYGYAGWQGLTVEVKRRLGGLEWALAEADRIIHDNDVERLKQLLAEYPALLSWRADTKGRGVLGMATSAYGDAADPQREQWFTRAACAEVLIDAGAVVSPSVCEGVLQSRARGMLDLFRRKGLLPRTLKFFAALGDIDAVRAALDENGNDRAIVDEAFIRACLYHHEAIASLLLERAITLDPDLGKNVDGSVGRLAFVKSFHGPRSVCSRFWTPHSPGPSSTGISTSRTFCSSTARTSAPIGTRTSRQASCTIWSSCRTLTSRCNSSSLNCTCVPFLQDDCLPALSRSGGPLRRLDQREGRSALPLHHCSTSKRQSVRERRRSDDTAKVLAHDRRRSEAALSCDSFDCQIGRFQELLRAANSYARNPGRWSGSDLLTKAAAQGPGTHRGALSQYRQRQIAAKVPVDPCQQRRQRRMVVHGRFMNDELRLPTGTFERHHGGSRGLGGDRGAEVASHQMQTQIENRGGTRGCQDIPVVNIENVGIYLSCGMAARQLVSAAPVGRGTPAVEDTGCAQYKRAGTNRRNACTSRERAANGEYYVVGNRPIQIADTWYDHSVGALHG